MTTVRGPKACAIAGITYRQLDYWCRNGILRPAVPARGSGTQRAFSERDVQVMWTLGQLSRLGAGLCDPHVLYEVDEWGGWLVRHPGGCEHVNDPDLLALWPVAVVIDLTACPVGASPPMAVPA